MKVALIAPPYPLSETPSVPLGLCYVASAIEMAGAEVRILDHIVRKYDPERLLAEISSFHPDVIGMTSVTMNFPVAASILERVKEGFPSAVTVMGGPHVSFDHANTLRRHPHIDVVVVGEGERTIVELLPVIENRNAWRTIAGIAFRDDGRIVTTGPRELIADVDSLPLPARHLLPMSRYLALGFPISIITSRGCPHRCIFCQGWRMVGNRVRSRGTRQIVDEIESLLSLGFERINFADDFFTSNHQRVRQICEEIHHRGLSFGWTVFARADSVDQDLLVTMRDAGCDTVFFGIESGNQAMLDRIKKRIKLDRIRRAVADCKAVGMTVFGSFVVGLPGETMDTLLDSLRFAEELDILHGYHYLSPFPGTEIMEQMDRYDLQLLSRDWSAFDANQPIIRTRSLSAEDIHAFVERYYTQHHRTVDENTEKRYREGGLNPSELLAFLGKRKLDIVFKLLSEDIIETMGTLRVSSHDADPEAELSEAIAARIDEPLEFVLLSIRYLVDRAYLKRERTGNDVAWSWA